MFYSLPYIILISALLMLSILQMSLKLTSGSNKILNLATGIIFVLFFGLKGFIGWDWYNYYTFFKNLPLLSSFNFGTTQFEFGFCLYASIIKSIYPNYHFFIFVSILIDFLLLNIFINRNLPKHLYIITIVFFIVMEGSIWEINLQRNIKGILLFLVSINYIEERKATKYFLLNLVGICFHWTSILFFPLYFILHKKVPLQLFFILFIIGNILYLFQLNYIQPFIKFISPYFGSVAEHKTNLYLSSSLYNKQYGITIGYIERVFTTTLVMLFYEKINSIKHNRLFVNSFIIYILISLYFSEVIIIITRIANIFIFSYWVLWPNLIDINKKASKYLLLMVMSLYLNLRLIKMTNNILYKYDNVIGESMSYSERTKIFDKNAHYLLK